MSPLMSSKSKKSLAKDLESEMNDGKSKDLAIAYSAQRHNKKKMANGGMVEAEKDASPMPAMNEKDDMKSPMTPIMKEKMPDHEEHYASIADAILKKKHAANMMADGGMVDDEGEADLQANSNEDLNLEDQLSFDAARKKTYYDLDQLDEQPEDSNEHGDAIDSDDHDMISSIRKKMKMKREL